MPVTAQLTAEGIPDGTYRTIIFKDGLSVDSPLQDVCDIQLAWENGAAQIEFGNEIGVCLLGMVIDSENPHVNGTPLTAITTFEESDPGYDIIALVGAENMIGWSGLIDPILDETDADSQQIGFNTQQVKIDTDY